MELGRSKFLFLDSCSGLKEWKKIFMLIVSCLLFLFSDFFSDSFWFCQRRVILLLNSCTQTVKCGENNILCFDVSSHVILREFGIRKFMKKLVIIGLFCNFKSDKQSVKRISIYDYRG